MSESAGIYCTRSGRFGRSHAVQLPSGTAGGGGLLRYLWQRPGNDSASDVRRSGQTASSGCDGWKSSRNFCGKRIFGGNGSDADEDFEQLMTGAQGIKKKTNK